MIIDHEIQFRVRYQETDAQGRVHHANYLTYFEMGRVEQLRASGYDYRRLEAEGTILVVAEISCKYFAPAQYDDVLTLKTSTIRTTAARIEHTYVLTRDTEKLVTGQSTLACINRDGQLQRIPHWLRT
ncbi:MAG: thioesterase family protein [Pirellulaceae bacterium]